MCSWDAIWPARSGSVDVWISRIGTHRHYFLQITDLYPASMCVFSPRPIIVIGWLMARVVATQSVIIV